MLGLVVSEDDSDALDSEVAGSDESDVPESDVPESDVPDSELLSLVSGVVPVALVSTVLVSSVLVVSGSCVVPVSSDSPESDVVADSLVDVRVGVVLVTAEPPAAARDHTTVRRVVDGGSGGLVVMRGASDVEVGSALSSADGTAPRPVASA